MIIVTTARTRAGDEANLERRTVSRRFCLSLWDDGYDRFTLDIDDTTMAAIVADYNAIVQDEALKSRVALDDESSRDGSRR